MTRSRTRAFNLKQLLAGGAALLALGLFLDLGNLPSFRTKQSHEDCQQILQPKAKLSRQQLAKLLTVPEGDAKNKIRTIIQEPYCTLSALQVRAGVPAEREAYLLEFAPQTRLVVLYEGDQYAGYRFLVY